jgi:hypothetical protein
LIIGWFIEVEIQPGIVHLATGDTAIGGGQKLLQSFVGTIPQLGKYSGGQDDWMTPAAVPTGLTD